MFSKKIFKGALLALSLVSLPAAGQMSRIEQDFVQWTQIAVDGNPPEGSNGFAELGNTTARADFALAVQAFLAENWALAETRANAVDYDVVAFRDTGNGETYYGLIPEPDNGGSRGFYFIRPRASVVRRLVVEAPHAVEDERTGVFASEIFRATGARAVLISGVDRCANLLSPSGCTGSTDCGAHKLSDMAHSVETFFQAFHELASAEHADTVTVQIHGFLADETGEPELSVSDGSQDDDIDPAYLPNLIYREIQEGMEAAVFPALPARNGNSCNLAGHQDFKCGTQSVQGRFTNGSNNACTANAPSANGRFIHLEMSNDLRDPADPADGDLYSQQIVIDALLHIRTAGRIGDRIWADLNGDNNEDPGEPGIHGALIEILDTNGTVAGSTTSVVGNYKVGNLGPGNYRVRVQLPAGYTYGSYLGPDGISHEFFLAVSQDRINIDLALNPPSLAQVGDFVWADDGDGFQEGSEGGLPQTVGVALLTPEGDVAASTTASASTGSYTLANVLPGDYVLRVTTPAGQGFTQQVTGAASVDSDVDPATGKSAVFSVGSGANDVSRDAGLVGPCFDAALVAKNALWKWKTGDALWPSDWTGASFDDSVSAGWQEGFSPLGFGNSKQVTGITAPNTAGGIYTTYFRLTFDVVDAALFRQPLQLTFSRDDGVILYLNGVEIVRRNLPWGAVTGAGTPASTGTETVETVSISPALLASGANVIAVELHQAPGDLTEGVLDLSLTGKACAPCRVHEQVITSTKATFLRSGSTQRGSRTVLELDGVSPESTGPAESILLQYDLAGKVPANAEVLHAELLFYTEAGSTSSDTADPYAIHALRRSWNEGVATWTLAETGANWQQAGATGANDSSPVRLGLMPVRTANGVEVSAQLNNAGLGVVEQWANNSAGNFGFLIDAEPNSDDGMDVYSDDEADSARRPRLKVIYLSPACQ